MCDYPFFIPQVVLFANSSLFWFKVTNEHREFRNYLIFLKSYLTIRKKFRMSQKHFLYPATRQNSSWKYGIHRLLTESNGTHFVSAIYRPLICLHPAFPVNLSPYNIFFLPYFHSLSICFVFISKYKTREKVKSTVPTL